MTPVPPVTHSAPQRPRFPRFVYIVHEAPGRIRLRLRFLREDEELARLLGARLAALSGVADVQLRPLTGSVVVRYDPARTDGSHVVSEVLRVTGVPRLSRAGHETTDELRAIVEHSVAHGSQLARSLIGAAKNLDRELLRMTGGEVSLGTTVSLTLGVAAAIRALSEDELPLPDWHQLAYWAFSLFTTIEDDVIDETPETPWDPSAPTRTSPPEVPRLKPRAP